LGTCQLIATIVAYTALKIREKKRWYLLGFIKSFILAQRTNRTSMCTLYIKQIAIDMIYSNAPCTSHYRMQLFVHIRCVFFAFSLYFCCNYSALRIRNIFNVLPVVFVALSYSLILDILNLYGVL